MANYYYLVTGLPDLFLNEGKPCYTEDEFKDLCYEQLKNSDRKIIDFFYLKYDCLNVVSLLENPEYSIDKLGTLTEEQCRILVEQPYDSILGASDIPSFLFRFVENYGHLKESGHFFPKDVILLEYYRYAMQCPSRDIASWFELNFNISNILTAYIARDNGWNISDYVLDGNEVSQEILKNSQVSNFHLDVSLDYVDDILKIASIKDPVMKEKQIDAFKWNWLEEHTFFEPFSIVSVFSYLCKLSMKERWEKLDVQVGREAFTQIVENLRKEARVPEEFKKK